MRNEARVDQGRDGHPGNRDKSHPGRQNCRCLHLEILDHVNQLFGLARIVLTDSDGVQEQAPIMGKPVLVMRENAERPEAAVDPGTVLLGTNVFDHDSLV